MLRVASFITTVLLTSAAISACSAEHEPTLDESISKVQLTKDPETPLQITSTSTSDEQCGDDCCDPGVDPFCFPIDTGGGTGGGTGAGGAGGDPTGGGGQFCPGGQQPHCVVCGSTAGSCVYACRGDFTCQHVLDTGCSNSFPCGL